MKTYLVLLLSLWGIGALALPGMPLPCPGQVHQMAVAQYKGLIQTVSQVGPIQNLFRYSDYATKHSLTADQMNLKFSGTGQFHCGGFMAAANLVRRNNLLLLAAHSFLDINENTHECHGILKNGDFRNCYFNRIDSNGNPINNGPQDRYYINPRTLQMGDYCRNLKVRGNDWAVVELNEEVPGIVPYDIADVSKMGKRYDNYGDPKDLKVTVVAGGNIMFHHNTPNLCDGIIGYLGPQFDPGGKAHFYTTNSCSASHGTSGAAIVIQRDNERSAIIATVSGALPDTKEYNGVPYGADNFTTGTFMEGDVMSAIDSCKYHCPIVRSSASN